MAAQVVKATQFPVLIAQDYQRLFHQAQRQVIARIDKQGFCSDQPPVPAKNMLTFVGVNSGIVVIVVS